MDTNILGIIVITLVTNWIGSIKTPIPPARAPAGHRLWQVVSNYTVEEFRTVTLKTPEGTFETRDVHEDPIFVDQLDKTEAESVIEDGNRKWKLKHPTPMRLLAVAPPRIVASGSVTNISEESSGHSGFRAISSRNLRTAEPSEAPARALLPPIPFQSPHTFVLADGVTTVTINTTAAPSIDRAEAIKVLREAIKLARE